MKGFEDIKSPEEALRKFGRKGVRMPVEAARSPQDAFSATQSTGKRSKYRNTPVETVEGVFDSLKEHGHWVTLKARQDLGEITGLRRQTSFDLYVVRPDGQRETIAKYISDFDYWIPARLGHAAKYVVEDVKQKFTRTPVYMLKRKMLFCLYAITINEV